MRAEFPENIKIAAAVSGGVDSMVMLTAMLDKGLKPLVVTVDHSIRGEDGAGDAEFVREFSKKNGLECEVYTVDVLKKQAETGYSTELQARILRYDIFDRILKDKKADAVCLAHHLSDQTETVLMRLMRGTGVGGLVAIRDREGYLHPMLRCTRAEIEGYAFRNSVPFREDQTNHWDGYLRNFVRNRVVPILRERCPTIERQTEKLIDSAAETEDFIAGFLMDAEVTDTGIAFPKGVFSLHDAVLKRSVAKGLKRLGFFQDLEVPAQQGIVSLKNKPSGKVEIGKGYVASREYDRLIIEKPSFAEVYKKPFSVSQIYEFGSRYEFIETNQIDPRVTFDLDKIPADAVVRTRLEGDRFRRYKGGDKSLSDYFTDTKTPRADRNRKLLLASASRIYAILGDEIADEAKCDETTKRMIRIERSDK